MAVKSDDYSAYTDFAKRTFAPAARLNETVAGHVERLTRFQYELAGELMQLALDQMHAAVNARDVGTLLARQSDLTTRFVDTMTARQQAFARLTTEGQASLAHWVEDAMALPQKAG